MILTVVNKRTNRFRKGYTIKGATLDMRNEWSKVILTQLKKYLAEALPVRSLFLWIQWPSQGLQQYGNYGCIELDLIFAQTVTDGIDIAKHWLLFHRLQTAPSVTAVYRAHTTEYTQPSLNLNHSWEKMTKKTWMQVWISHILLLKGTTL